MVYIRPYTMINNPSSTTTTTTSIMYDRPSSLPIHFSIPQTSSNYSSTYSTIPLLTPSTPITPNTLKSIEQSILQTLGEDTAEASFFVESNQYSGNFVPPLPSNATTTNTQITLINTWQGGQVSSDGVSNGDVEGDLKVELKSEPELEHKVVETSNNNNNTRKRKAPVRKQSIPKQPTQQQQPKQTKKQNQQKPAMKRQRSAEEDERRRIRRERNKLAAARCRKRRVDHTNKLQEETDGLEAKKRELQEKINELQSQKEELEFVLDAHPCVKKVRTNEVLSDLQNLPRTVASSSIESFGSGGKPKRPSSLNVIATDNRIATTTGSTPSLISISTPSNGITGLGFDSLVPDCWGVTPDGVTEKHVPVTSNNVSDNNKNCSLVTPVSNPYKKLQDL